MIIFHFILRFNFFLLSFFLPEPDRSSNTVADPDPWKEVEEIRKHIVAPKFADRTFMITDFGARGDGKTDCTAAFRKAIQACNSEGGGKVVVPPGKFHTGAIHLKSNVNLHVSEGATILFSIDPKDYLPLVYTRWEGVELMNYSPLIYAYQQKNIAITGKGVLDGQASSENWWKWKGKVNYGWKAGTPSQLDANGVPRLMALGEEGVPVKERIFGEGYYLRPPLVQPYACENVLIEGVTMKNSPMWVMNPVLCTNVIVQDVVVESMGPNSDGCDPESSRYVLIRNCTFKTGDDCIAIKSGRNADGRRVNVPSENILIQDCKMADGHGGVVIGSEISGNVRNVFAEDCLMDSPHLQRAVRLKTNSKRGGTIENIYVRNIEVGQVSDQVLRINMRYQGETGPHGPVIRNIHISDVTVENGGKTGILLEGLENAPIENVTLENVKIDKVKDPYNFDYAQDVVFRKVEINGEKINGLNGQGSK